ncbi:hypothetical protein ACIRNI_18905 [Streptomyces sp. NPDC093546]|uniref:hypothetical protein n=1 Tax=Streptomyces sp. NPDC093546 TaxID=3366040 RepID=UPI00382FCC9C
MHAYEPSRYESSRYESSRQPYHQIPAMRPAQDGMSGASATPIYDALYSEYLRTFRTLPGDRSGEEDLDFRSFAAVAGAHRPVSATTTTTAYPGMWQRQHPPVHVPAALPPARRGGL